MENIKKWLALEVPAIDMSILPDGAKYIPIEKAEDLLDKFHSWSTQNFNFYMYRGEGYGNLGVAASIELVVEYKIGNKLCTRTFVGTCSFPVKSIYPNPHFLSTAKSECVKNAMSDIGKRLGRWLNNESPVPSTDKIKEANDGIDMPTSFNEVNLKTNATKI